MYVNIIAPTTEKAKELVEYLDKENRLSKQFIDYLDKEVVSDADCFFNDSSIKIESEEVYQNIDGNCQGIGKEEARFYPILIAPSAKELEHLNDISDNLLAKIKDNDIEHDLSLSDDELKEIIMKTLMKEYTIKSMDNYAKAFGRENINDASDLMWYGRAERERYWKSKDSQDVRKNEVIYSKIEKLAANGEVNSDRITKLNEQLILESTVISGGRDIPIRDMMPKPSTYQNYHVHIIVSRKSKSGKSKLSPMANSKGHAGKVGKNSFKVGFDRDKWYQQCEDTFDNYFLFTRKFEETYSYFKEQKKISQGRELSINEERIKRSSRYSEEVSHSDTDLRELRDAELREWREISPVFSIRDSQIEAFADGYARLSFDEYNPIDSSNEFIANQDILDGTNIKAIENYLFVERGLNLDIHKNDAEIALMINQYAANGVIVIPRFSKINIATRKYFEIVECDQDKFVFSEKKWLSDIEMLHINNHAKLYCKDEISIFKEAKRMELSYYKDGYIETLYNDDNAELFKKVNAISTSQLANGYLEKANDSVIDSLRLDMAIKENISDIENKWLYEYEKISKLFHIDNNLYISRNERMNDLNSEGVTFDSVNLKRDDFEFQDRDKYSFNREGVVMYHKFYDDALKSMEIKNEEYSNTVDIAIKVATDKIIRDSHLQLSSAQLDRYSQLDREMMYLQYMATGTIYIPKIDDAYIDMSLKLLGGEELNSGVCLKDAILLSANRPLSAIEIEKIYNHAKQYCGDQAALFREAKRMELSYYKDGYIETLEASTGSNIFRTVDSISTSQLNNNYLSSISDDKIHELNFRNWTHTNINRPQDIRLVHDQLVDMRNEMIKIKETKYINSNSLLNKVLSNHSRQAELTVLGQEYSTEIITLAYAKAREERYISVANVDLKREMYTDITNDIENNIKKIFDEFLSTGKINVYVNKSTDCLVTINEESIPSNHIFNHVPIQYVDAELRNEMIALAEIYKSIEEGSVAPKYALTSYESIEFGYYTTGTIIIPKDVEELLKCYCSTGEITLPQAIKDLGFSQEMPPLSDVYKVVNYNAITGIELDFIKTIAEAKHNKNDVLTGIRRMKMSYYSTGIINVPAIKDLIIPETIDKSKFVFTNYRILSEKEIITIKKIAHFNVTNYHVDSTNTMTIDKNRFDKECKKEYNRLESQYYNRGDISINKVDFDINEKEIFHVTEKRAFTKLDNDFVEALAIYKVNTYAENLTNKEKYNLINKEKWQIKNAYDNADDRLIIPNIGVDCDATKFAISEYRSLTKEDYALINDIASSQVNMRLGDNFKEFKGDYYIERGVRTLEGVYYNTGVIDDSSRAIDLNSADYKLMFAVAEQKIEARYDNVLLEDLEKERLIYSEIVSMEKNYAATGEMYVYNTDVELNSKFKISEHKPLTSADYGKMKEIATIKIDAKELDLEEKERSRQIYSDVEKMRYQYMNNGNISVPKDVDVTFDKAVFSEAKMLTAKDIKVLSEVAEYKISELNPNIDKADRIELINKEMKVLENTYYLRSELAIPNLGLTCDKEKFLVSTGQTLDKADYRVLHDVATHIVNAKSPSDMPIEEKTKLIEREYNKLEYKYYAKDRSPKITEKKFLFGVTRKTIKSRVEFLLPKGDYQDVDLSKFKTSNIEPLNCIDIDVIKKIVEDKINNKYENLTPKEIEERTRTESNRMENLYYREGIINVPKIQGIDYANIDKNKFARNNFETLNRDDYKNIEIAAKNKVEQVYIKEGKKAFDPTLDEKRAKDVEREISKLEYSYYMSGKMFVPKTKEYNNLNEDKFVMLEQRTMAQALGYNLKRAAITAIYSTTDTELQGHKKAYQTTIKSIKMYKNVKGIQNERIKQIAVSTAKGVASRSAMSLISKAVPYANVVALGVDITKTVLKNENTNEM